MGSRTLLDMFFSPPAPGLSGLNAAEVMNFLFGVIGGALLLALRRRGRLARFRFLYAAYALLMCAYSATIAEGFAWWGLFNLVEHASLALSGIVFAMALLSLSRPPLPAGKVEPGGGEE